MLMCSTTPGNDCQVISTPIKEFNNNYECTIYGYTHSADIIISLSKEFVNKYGAYTKFACKKTTNI